MGYDQVLCIRAHKRKILKKNCNFSLFFVIEIRLFRLSFAVCKFSGIHETAGVMVKRSKANIDSPLLLIDQLPKTWYAF